jgi:hypothetical protein
MNEELNRNIEMRNGIIADLRGYAKDLPNEIVNNFHCDLDNLYQLRLYGKTSTESQAEQKTYTKTEIIKAFEALPAPTNFVNMFFRELDK